MFLNVACGPKASQDLKTARAELSAIGVSTLVVKGPLIMKTVGKTKGAEADSVWIPMPLQTGSTYDFLHRVTDKAYTSLKEKYPAMDLRLGGEREEPHFAHNSWRRMAAVLRIYRSLTGIDHFFDSSVGGMVKWYEMWYMTLLIIFEWHVDHDFDSFNILTQLTRQCG